MAIPALYPLILNLFFSLILNLFPPFTLSPSKGVNLFSPLTLSLSKGADFPLVILTLNEVNGKNLGGGRKCRDCHVLQRKD